MQEIKSEAYAGFENEIQKSTDIDSVLDLNNDILMSKVYGDLTEKEAEELLKMSSEKCKKVYL